jgi:hypothetical protein
MDVIHTSLSQGPTSTIADAPLSMLHAAVKPREIPPPRGSIFVLPYSGDGILICTSARKHGIPDDDIAHALAHPRLIHDIERDPSHRQLILGPSRTGAPLELVVLSGDDGRVLVIHAMKLRRKYWPFWKGGGHG